MKIVVINGSMRSDSQSLKVSNWLVSHSQNIVGCEAELLDLHKNTLPLFDVGETEASNKNEILSQLDAADGFVFVSPEWNGMASHGIFNLQHYTDKQLAHKPVMLVGVSAGRGGHYPVSQMRQTGYKNNQYVIIPEALIVQGVNDAFNDHNMAEEAKDASLKLRADYGLKILNEYAKSLKMVRDSGLINHKSFGNGM